MPFFVYMPALLAVPSPVVRISRIWFMTLVSCRLWTLFTASVTDLALELASLSSLAKDYQLRKGECFWNLMVDQLVRNSPKLLNFITISRKLSTIL